MIVRRLRGLRVQLLLWTILPLSVVLVVLSLAGVFRHRQAMSLLVEDRDRGITAAEASSLGRQIERRATMLSAASHTVDLSGDSPAAALSSLDQTLEDNFEAGLALYDSSGRLVAASASARDWPQLPSVTDLAVRAARSSQAAFSQGSGGSTDPVLFMAAPIAADRIVVGASLAAGLHLQEVGAQLHAEAQGTAYLLDSAGRPVLAGNSSAQGLDTASIVHTAQATPHDAVITRVRTPGGQNLVVSAAMVDPPGWTLVMTEDMNAMEAMGISYVEVLPMLLLFVAVLALLAVSFGVANVVRPLQELDRRATRVAWGDFEALDSPVGGVQEADDLRVTLAQMAARIRSYQAGMRDYLSAITQAQEDERSRLAHELHDDTVQALIALKQRAQMAQKALCPSASSGQEADPGRAEQRLEELGALIDQELISLRRLIGDLRPIYLEDLGFVPALEMLAKQVQEQHKLAVDTQVAGEPVRLAPDLELAAFRIVQQALRNVVTHASAGSVHIQVTFAADGLTLTVADDGVGFAPPEQPGDLVSGGHFGLMGMRERALLYGGRLSIISAPGHGTTISAWLPVC